eukprot:scaffold15017_cov64-Phaeocystis_antarctica.AAC.4
MPRPWVEQGSTAHVAVRAAGRHERSVHKLDMTIGRSAACSHDSGQALARIRVALPGSTRPFGLGGRTKLPNQRGAPRDQYAGRHGGRQRQERSAQAGLRVGGAPPASRPPAAGGCKDAEVERRVRAVPGLQLSHQQLAQLEAFDERHVSALADAPGAQVPPLPLRPPRVADRRRVPERIPRHARRRHAARDHR